MKRYGLVLAVLVAMAPFVGVLPSAAEGPSTNRAGRAEVRFLEGMSDHHQMALDMANECLKKAKTGEVLKLCADIIKAQGPEINQMRDWLLNWYQIDYKSVSMAQMTHDTHTTSASATSAATLAGTAAATQAGNIASDPAGMMGMMAGFNRLEGRNYELAFLESMVDHHDDALHMSTRVLKYASHKELRTFADKIIKDQTAEIQKMEGLIAKLGKK